MSKSGNLRADKRTIRTRGVGRKPKLRTRATAAEFARQQPDQAQAKVGRNDPCPCGCGRKAKVCDRIQAVARSAHEAALGIIEKLEGGA